MKLNVSEVTYLFYNRKSYDYKKLDELMEEALGIPNFSEGKIRLTKDQYEVVIGLLDVLLHKGELNDRDKTDSGAAQVRQTDGDENNRLQGIGRATRINSGLADLRSVPEMRSNPDVSDIPTERRTEN
jgi:hypothetical protein